MNQDRLHGIWRQLDDIRKRLWYLSARSVRG
jgi:hypothetical protein